MYSCAKSTAMLAIAEAEMGLSFKVRRNQNQLLSGFEERAKDTVLAVDYSPDLETHAIEEESEARWSRCSAV